MMRIDSMIVLFWFVPVALQIPPFPPFIDARPVYAKVPAPACLTVPLSKATLSAAG